MTTAGKTDSIQSPKHAMKGFVYDRSYPIADSWASRPVRQGRVLEEASTTAGISLRPGSPHCAGRPPNRIPWHGQPAVAPREKQWEAMGSNGVRSPAPGHRTPASRQSVSPESTTPACHLARTCPGFFENLCGLFLVLRFVELPPSNPSLRGH